MGKRVGFAGISSSMTRIFARHLSVAWQSLASPYGRVFRKSLHLGTALGARRLS